MIRDIRDWFKKPFDRCVYGNHRMITKSGYIVCRKHQHLKPHWRDRDPIH